MKVRCIIPLVLLFCALNPCFSQQGNKLSFDVSVRQNGRTISYSDDIYALEDNIFDILVTNKNKNTIHIFAYHTNEMFNKYVYPIKCEDTVMFHPAAALIDAPNENKEIQLVINREMQYNVITPEKILNNNGISIIRINQIADAYDKFDGILFLTIFVDLNNNKVIESNEVKNMSIIINWSGNNVLFKARAYISTMGGWIRDINNSVYGNDYFYVKISSELEKATFFELFGQNYGDYSYTSTNRVRNANCSIDNLYIIFSPVTTEIELAGNPYRYNGENRLIFDTRINKDSNKGKYVFYREYLVPKNNTQYEMWVNIDGSLRKIRELSL